MTGQEETLIKKLILCILILLSIPLSAMAEDRWQWIDSDDWSSVYVDRDTMKYSAQRSELKYWIKTSYLSGWTYTTLMQVDLFDRTQLPLFQQTTGPDGVTRERDIRTGAYLIRPGSRQEKEANFACESFRIPYVWGIKDHSWKWVYADRYYDFYVCTDTCEKRGSEYALFTKAVKPGSERAVFTSSYMVNFDEPYVKWYSANGRKRVIAPGSREEILYRAAADVVKGIYGKGKL